MHSPTCLLCGRNLTNPVSLAKGIGPECEARQGAMLAAAGSSSAEYAKLLTLDRPQVSRWLYFGFAALRVNNLRDARRFFAQARSEARQPNYSEVA